MKKILFIILFALVSHQVACDGSTHHTPTENSKEDAKPKDQRIQLVEQAWTTFFKPALEDLISKSDNLAKVSEKYCEGNGQATLDEVKTAWLGAYKALKRQEIYGFGPYKNVTYAPMRQLDQYPVDEKRIESFVAGLTTIKEEDLRKASIYYVGFPAIEYLLWGPTPPMPNTVRCEYLIAASQRAHLVAKDLFTAWNPEQDGFFKKLLDPKDERLYYKTPVRSAEEIVNRIWFILENVVADRLGRPAGSKTKGSANPLTAEAKYSGKGIEAIKSYIQAAKDCYFGMPGAKLTVSQLIKARDSDLDASIAKAFDDVSKKIDAISMPIQEAVVNEPDKIKALLDSISALQRLIQMDVLSKLGLNQHERDADGD